MVHSFCLQIRISRTVFSGWCHSAHILYPDAWPHRKPILKLLMIFNWNLSLLCLKYVYWDLVFGESPCLWQQKCGWLSLARLIQLYMLLCPLKVLHLIHVADLVDSTCCLERSIPVISFTMAWSWTAVISSFSRIFCSTNTLIQLLFGGVAWARFSSNASCFMILYEELGNQIFGTLEPWRL